MLSIKDIENLPRNSDGRIVLDSLVEERDYEIQLENKGKRYKEWLVFSDGRILKKTIKPNTNEDYAELIVEEINKQMGVENAHYDLATINGQNFVLSWDFVDKEKETLVSGKSFLVYNLQNLINMGQYQRKAPEDQKELNNLEFIERVLAQYLSPLELEEEMKKFDMIFALNCFVLNGDVHLSNWSLLHSKETKSYRMAPNYDAGSAFRFNIGPGKLQPHIKNLFRNKNPEVIKRILEDHMFGGDFNKHNSLNYSYENTDELGMTRLEEAFKKEPDRFLPCLMKLYKVNPYAALQTVEERLNGIILPDIVLDTVLLVIENNRIRIEKMMEEVYGNTNMLKGAEECKG